jgi:hypothetical protein
MDKEEFIKILRSKKGAPYLFLGSGFAKHYIGTPSWKGLLEKFAPRPISYYTSMLDSDSLVKVATQIAKDLNEMYWKLDQDSDEYKKYEGKINSNDAYLRNKICDYLKKISIQDIPEEFRKEVEVLTNLNIDGIITTNWDDTAERFFPKFKKFIGQNQLLFASVFGIGEIYKIHGCMSEPDSLVLTEKDYADFNKRNAYLAAKLITIFIEHPVVFLGYSLSDNNIQEILQSLVLCLDSNNIDKLQDNLIFVEWSVDENQTTQIERKDLILNYGKITLPVTRIYTHNYKDVYQLLSYFERSLPANLLREYKKQFYNIVVSEKPEKRLCVLPSEAIDKDKSIQVVYGFGAIKKFRTAIGYRGLKATELLKDVLSDEEIYNPNLILKESIPDLRKTSPKAFIPIYKYLSEVGIHNDSDYNNNQLGVNIPLRKKIDFQTYNFFNDDDKKLSLNDALQKYSDFYNWKAMALIPYLNITEDEYPLLVDFINSNFTSFIVKKNGRSTFMRRLICFYDWLKYGWD